MIATYASAALICAASLLVGRAVLSLAGRREWTWLEPAVGFASILIVTGALARAPGHSTTATLGLIALLVAAALVCRRLPHSAPAALGQGLAVVLVVAIVLSIPFAISGRWGFLGQGFNNDLGLHLAWAEWLRSGLGPAPEAGYPLGPHGLAAAIAAVPGIGLAQAFIGEVFAIGVLTALTALTALRELGAWRRVLAATLVATTYLAASYFAQAAFKETTEALLVLAFALALRDLDRRQDDQSASAGRRADQSALAGRRADQSTWGGLIGPSAGGNRLFVLPFLALLGGAFFAYSFAGLAWPLAILALWSLTLPEVRQALAPRALLRFLLKPAVLAGLLVLVGLGAVTVLVGPFGFIHGFNRVAGSNTYGPVSPIEALGIWPTSNYRLDAAGGAQLAGLAGTIAVLALVVGIAWWVRARDLAVPIALGACAALYLASLPFSGEYSQAKALMIGAPLAMLVAIRPLLTEFGRRRDEQSIPAGQRDDQSAQGGLIGPSAGVVRVAWGVLAVAFVGGAVYSSFLALRDAPVGPPGHGAELRGFFPRLQGEKVLYAGQDRYAAHELLEADTHVPLVEFPDSEVDQSPEKPFDTGDAYSPIDFDSFSTATLDRMPYVVTGRAAWNSQAPPNFKRVAATPSYLLWERVGSTPEDRHVLLEGTEPAAPAPCASPEIRILLANAGRASLFPAPGIGAKARWRPDSTLEPGESASQLLRLPPGRWNLSLQYFSPFELTLSAHPEAPRVRLASAGPSGARTQGGANSSAIWPTEDAAPRRSAAARRARGASGWALGAPGFSQPLKAALDGQRPSTISLASDGQYWPAGQIESDGGPLRFTIEAEEASALQRLSGWGGRAQLGNLVAVRAEPRRIVPLGDACEGWIDWFESPEAP